MFRETAAPCLGCTLTCPRRDGRRVSKRLIEKCVRDGGNLASKSPPLSFPSQSSITSGIPETPTDRTYSCEHRSTESVSKVGCKSCGKKPTLIKVFRCDSPEVDKPLCTIPESKSNEYAACESCNVRTIPGSVLRDQIVAGVTTTPNRKTSRLHETLKLLERAGFDEPYVFSDGSPHPDYVPKTMRNNVGGWSNFYLGLTELYHRYPTAGLYAMFQDDVLACEGLADYLVKTVDNSYPVWSAFNAAVNGTTKQGWNRIDRKFAFCGAQALVFTNEGVRKFLSDPEVVRYRRFPNAEGRKAVNDGRTHIDGVVGRYAHKQGRKGVAVHHPSLISHIGDTSVMHPSSSPEDPHRKEAVFLGENYPLDAFPHVGVMMISGGAPERRKYVREAVEDFIAQDYAGEATLVIFDYHEEILPDDVRSIFYRLRQDYPEIGGEFPRRDLIWRRMTPKSIGLQRQEVVDFAKQHFPLLLWQDDDDRVSPDYLSYRVSTCPPGAASILSRQTLFYDDGSGRLDVRMDTRPKEKGFFGFPGTIMFPSCFGDVRYRDLNNREDTEFALEMAKRTTLISLPNPPEMFRRRVHNWNICDRSHLDKIASQWNMNDG